MEKKLFEYNWEDSYDFSRDMEEMLDEIVGNNGGEWPGTLKIFIEYDPDNE